MGLDPHRCSDALSCQVWVYSGRGSSQVQTEMDKGRGQGAGQGISPAGGGDCLDSTTRVLSIDPLCRFQSRRWSWRWRQRQTETGVETKLISD